MKWREMKGNVLRWIEGAQSVCSWDVIRFFSVSFYLLPSRLDFNSFLPCPSIIFYLLSYSRSMQYLSFPSLQFFGFPFSSFHFISFRIHLSSLFQFFFSLQMIKPSRMIRESKQNYGPQSTFSYLNCFIINDTEVVHNHQISLHNWYVF